MLELCRAPIEAFGGRAELRPVRYGLRLQLRQTLVDLLAKLSDQLRGRDGLRMEVDALRTQLAHLRGRGCRELERLQLLLNLRHGLERGGPAAPKARQLLLDVSHLGCRAARVVVEAQKRCIQRRGLDRFEDRHVRHRRPQSRLGHSVSREPA